VNRLLALVLLVLLVLAPAAARAAEEQPAAQESPAAPAAAGEPATDAAPATDPAADAEPTDPFAGGAFAPNPYLGMDAGFGFPGEAAPPAPAFAGSGTDALLRTPDLRGNQAPTLFERYGSQGLALDAGAGSGGEESLGALAAGLFGVAVWLAHAVIAVFQWAFTLELFDFVGDAVTGIVGELRDLLYVPFVQAMVIAAGLWFAWHGMVRRRATVAFEGMVWVVAALAIAGVFLVRPSLPIDGANHLSTGLSRGVLAGVSAVDPMAGPADGTSTTATYDQDAADRQLRVAADRFWRVFVYQPWLVLQFGDHEAGARYGERLLETRTVTTDEQAEVAGDQEALTALIEAKAERYTALQAEIADDQQLAAWFGGQRSVERSGVATLALAGVLLGGVLLAVLAAAILLAQLALLLLVVLAPLLLLLGIHPGAGRVLTVRWAELAVGLLIKRVALGVLLAVVLVLNGVLLDATYPLGWLVTMGLQALVVATVVVYRKPFARLLAPTTAPAATSTVRTVGAPIARQAAQQVRQWRTDRRPAPRPASPRPRPGTPAPLPTATEPAAARPLVAVAGARRRPRAPHPASPQTNGHGPRAAAQADQKAPP
jgi:hypothetical protein